MGGGGFNFLRVPANWTAAFHLLYIVLCFIRKNMNKQSDLFIIRIFFSSSLGNVLLLISYVFLGFSLVIDRKRT